MEKLLILIAEDDEDDRSLLRTAFRDTGLPDVLKFVENGVELINYLSKLPQQSEAEYPGFILLDLNMPKKNGFEVLQEIKQHNEFKIIPVVVFATTGNEKEIRRCYELGANTYIKKPTSYTALVNVLSIIRSYWFNVVTPP